MKNILLSIILISCGTVPIKDFELTMTPFAQDIREYKSLFLCYDDSIDIRDTDKIISEIRKSLPLNMNVNLCKSPYNGYLTDFRIEYIDQFKKEQIIILLTRGERLGNTHSLQGMFLHGLTLGILPYMDKVSIGIHKWLVDRNGNISAKKYDDYSRDTLSWIFNVFSKNECSTNNCVDDFTVEALLNTLELKNINSTKTKEDVDTDKRINLMKE